MRARAVAVVAAACLAAPGAAAAGAPLLPKGKAIAVYAPLRPTVILFGDSLRLDLTVLVDRRRIDPATVRMRGPVQPFEAARPAQPARRDLGHATQLRFPIVLRCVTYACVPTGQFTLVHLRHASVVYELRGRPGKPRSVHLRLPTIEVASRINPATLIEEKGVLPAARVTPYASHIVPLPAPTYRAPPALLVGAVAAAAALLLLAAVAFGRRHLLARRPPRPADRAAAASQLDHALAFLAWAQEHGDETVRRKAIERVAAELGNDDGAGELASQAHRLAWAEPSPPAAEVAELAERVRRETGP